MAAKPRSVPTRWGRGKGFVGLERVPVIFMAGVLAYCSARLGGSHQRDHMLTLLFRSRMRLLIEKRIQTAGSPQSCGQRRVVTALPVVRLTSVVDVDPLGPGSGTCRTDKSIVVSSESGM